MPPLDGAAGGFLAVLAQTALTTGRSASGAIGLVPEVAADSRPVAVALGRAGVVAVGAAVALVAGRRPGGLYAAAGMVALGGLLAPIAGHPWTADPIALAVPADGLHLLAASVWVGLLAALALTARRLPEPLAAVRGVSSLALVASGVLLVTGTVSAWLLLGSVDALLHTASGQLVIAKVIGADRVEAPEPALVGAGPDRTDGPGSTPEAAVGASQHGTSPATALGRLLQVVRIEVVIGALVLAVTAGLVNQPPGRDVVAEPFVDSQTAPTCPSGAVQSRDLRFRSAALLSGAVAFGLVTGGYALGYAVER
ncbi:MAG: hypothetical protein ACR2JF_15925 [Iamia sp.]